MRKLWAAGAAIVLCLALGGLPVAGQESSEQPLAASTTIGFSSFYTDTDFFGDIRRGAQEAASTAGVELIALNAYGDPTMQADHLESFIADGVDAIIIVPVDPVAIVPSVEAANAAGIPVLAVDRTATGGMITSLIASDNVAAARMAAEALFDLMGGSGKVVEIQGDMAVSMGMDRSEGFGEALEAAPGITLAVQAPADLSYRLASQATRDALEQDPDITGVFAANLDMLQGAAQAVASAGKTDQVRIVGFDTSPTVLTAISDGSIDATVAQQPLLIGQQAVEAALAAVAGEPVEPFIPVETILVTADNVDEF
jgi:ABC-type sugar transport system substrate-binding protein